MTYIKKFFWHLTTGLFLSMWLITRSCNGPAECPEYKPVKTTIKKVDSTENDIKPTAISPPKIIYVPVPVDVDTAQILKDYFAKNIFERSISDSNIYFYIEDTISQNSITGYRMKYKIYRPTEIVYQTDYYPVESPKLRNKLFWNGEIYSNFDNFTGLYFGADLITKKDKKVGYAFDPFNKTHKVSFGGKISFRRKQK